jgi:hypothetical protein
MGLKKEEKEDIVKYFKEAEERIFKKIRLRMAVLAKDNRLKAKMERDIRANLNKSAEQ